MPAKHSRLITIILASLLVFLAFLLVPTTTDNQVKRQGTTATLVKTQKVAKATLRREVKALGTALAFDSTKIVSASNDYLTVLNINEGQPVQKGTILAQFNDLEEKARVAELTALLSEQKRQLARLKNLTNSKASAQSMFDEQQAKVNATTAQLDAAQSRLQDMVIKAPFDGVLGLRQVSNGAFLSAGTTLTTLDDISKIRVEFNAAEHYLAELQPGMPMRIKNIAFADIEFKGTLNALDPRIDPITRSVKGHGLIANEDLKLKPGMLLNVTIELAVNEVLQIPEKAIVPLQNRHYVFVVDGKNQVSQREVTLGLRTPGQVEVRSGLAVGDEIVIEGTQKLRSGLTITKVE